MNGDPVVEQIMQAYMKTYLTERQFEDMILKALADAEERGKQNAAGGGYDKGFSEGYDACLTEHSLAE